MKKLLIIPMLFACYMVMGQNAAKIIGKPYQLKNIEVARNDFPNKQNWNDAIAKCNKLGEGWRLPTSDELNKLYNNRKKIGGFKDNYFDGPNYWSSSESADRGYGIEAKFQIFSSGAQGFESKANTYNVRAVRSK